MVLREYRRTLLTMLRLGLRGLAHACLLCALPSIAAAAPHRGAVLKAEVEGNTVVIYSSMKKAGGCKASVLFSYQQGRPAANAQARMQLPRSGAGPLPVLRALQPRVHRSQARKRDHRRVRVGEARWDRDRSVDGPQSTEAAPNGGIA